MNGYYVKCFHYKNDPHPIEILLLPVKVLHDGAFHGITFKRGGSGEHVGLPGAMYYLRYPRSNYGIKKYMTETYIRGQIREAKNNPIPPSTYRIPVGGVDGVEDIMWLYKDAEYMFQCTEVCGIEEDWGYETLILV